MSAVSSLAQTRMDGGGRDCLAPSAVLWTRAVRPQHHVGLRVALRRGLPEPLDRLLPVRRSLPIEIAAVIVLRSGIALMRRKTDPLQPDRVALAMAAQPETGRGYLAKRNVPSGSMI